MFYSSHIEISYSCLENNIRFIKKQLGPGVKFCSVIKGNAYGHGIKQFAPLVKKAGCDYFGVYSTDEAYQTYKTLDGECNILIMGMAEGDGLEWAIQHGAEFFVFGLERLEDARDFAKKMRKKARIHLELETGMNRTGFNSKDLKKAAEFINDNRDYFEVKGACTHYAGSESISNYVRVKDQYNSFKKLNKKLNRYDIHPELQHTACSASMIAYPKTIMDMARVGILQYGFWPSEEVKVKFLISNGKKNNSLRRVISWKSKVMAVKSVKKGDFVGYGTSFMANKDMKIAVVPIGYAHGYTRALSNYGRVLIRGKRLNVIGIVNMNVITVNVDDLPVVEKGDEVVLIGKQKKHSISVASFGELSNQLNYELLTRLPQDIPRKVIE